MSLGEIITTDIKTQTAFKKFKPPTSPVKNIPQKTSPTATLGVTNGATPGANIQGIATTSTLNKKNTGMKLAYLNEAHEMLTKRASALIPPPPFDANDGFTATGLNTVSGTALGLLAGHAATSYLGRNRDSLYDVRKATQKFLKDNPKYVNQIGDLRIGKGRFHARTVIEKGKDGIRRPTVFSTRNAATTLREVANAGIMAKREGSLYGKVLNRAAARPMLAGWAGTLAGMGAASLLGDSNDPVIQTARIALPVAGAAATTLPNYASKIKSTRVAYNAMNNVSKDLKAAKRGKRTLAAGVLAALLDAGAVGVGAVAAGHALNNIAIGAYN